MATSRYDNERLRAIEEQLRGEDPGYVGRLERSAGDLPEEPASSGATHSYSTSTPVQVCAWIIGTLLLLVLTVSLADPQNQDFASDAGAASTATSTAVGGTDSVR